MSAPAPERPIADVIEDRLVKVDLLAHLLYGPREDEWTDSQWSDYEIALATARRGEVS